MQHVSTIYARFITRELQLSTAEIDDLLHGSALNAAALLELNNMRYLDFFDFLNRVKQRFNDPALGLKVGQKLAPMSLGELGHAMLVAPDLKESLALAANFTFLHAAYMKIQLSANFDSISMVCIEQADLGETQQFQTEVMLLLIQNMIEAVIGEPFIDGGFYFPYQTPSNVACYENYFHSPTHFGEENARIEIPKRYLSIQSPYYNPVFWKRYQLQFVAQLTELLNTSDKPFTNHIDALLRAYPPPLPTMSEAASSLNMSERTLNRRLSDEGASFRTLRNAVMQHHATFYLNETDLTVDAIADQLGYKDFSSFRRVFKKWTGLSPQAFRRNET